METDIRWLQRLQNYTKALSNLTEAVELATQRPLSNLEKQGLIQSFEFTHSKNLITNGEVWMSMIKSRNQTSHTYNQGIADDITDLILKCYHAEFMSFLQSMQQLKSTAI